MALIIVMSNLNDCFAFGFSGSNFLKRLVDVFEREYFIHRCLNLPLCKNLGDTLKTLPVFMDEDEIVVLITPILC